MSTPPRQPVRRLPPGPHGLPPELVERNQRERLIAAMAEVCGERGYAASSVAEVAKHAGVSTASFYRQFEDKAECMLASFEELFGRLLEAIRTACADADESETRTRNAIRVVAAQLGADLPTARLLSVEILAMGSEGVLAQHGAIEEIATLLRHGAIPESGVDIAWVTAAASVAHVAGRSAEGKEPEAETLEAIVAISLSVSS